MESIRLNKKEIDPKDILSGLRTLKFKDAIKCKWLEYDWLPSEKYLEWAKVSINEKNDYGYSTAIIYSKKCVCRRIDALILYNHLHNYKNKRYPFKLDILNKIGIKSFNIIQEMIIDPRNELEHLYKKPSKEIAEKCIQLAEMYLDATQKDFDEGSIIVIDAAFLCAKGISSGNLWFKFHGYSDGPMFVVDIINNEIKLIFPKLRLLRNTS